MKPLVVILLLASSAGAGEFFSHGVPIQREQGFFSGGVPVSRMPPAPVIYPLYPTDGRHSWSGCSGWPHLTDDKHAGKFDHAWLKWLGEQPNGLAMLRELHDADHNEMRYGGRYIDWQFVVQPGGVVQATRVQAVKKKAVSQNCPGGRCPTGAPGFFRRYLF